MLQTNSISILLFFNVIFGISSLYAQQLTKQYLPVCANLDIYFLLDRSPSVNNSMHFEEMNNILNQVKKKYKREKNRIRHAVIGYGFEAQFYKKIDDDTIGSSVVNLESLDSSLSYNRAGTNLGAAALLLIETLEGTLPPPETVEIVIAITDMRDAFFLHPDTHLYNNGSLTSADLISQLYYREVDFSVISVHSGLRSPWLYRRFKDHLVNPIQEASPTIFIPAYDEEMKRIRLEDLYEFIYQRLEQENNCF